MSHPVGAVIEAHHGLAMRCSCPMCSTNRPMIARMTDLARYLDLPNPSDAVPEWVLGLRERLAIRTQASGSG